MPTAVFAGSTNPCPSTGSGSANTLIKPFYPALDGLRAIAFLLVFLQHAATAPTTPQGLQWGWTGVDLFFVLSGFLITGILYDSLSSAHYFRNFYVRRSLRIFPLIVAFWLAVLALTPFLHILWNRYNLAMVAYIGNFFIAGGSAGLHAAPDKLLYPSLRHPGITNVIDARALWSLCVEEQFYLLWPAVVCFVRSRRALICICIAGTAASLLSRLLYMHWWPQLVLNGGIYCNTICRADTLLFGSLLALWLRGPVHTSVAALRRIAYLLITVCPLVLLALYLSEKTFPFTQTASSVSTFGFTLIALAATGWIILAIDPSTQISRLLKLRPLVWLGRISYGMYIYHSFLLSALNGYPPFASGQFRWTVFSLGLSLTILVSWISFRLLESPFLRLKDRLAPTPGKVSDPPPAPAG